VLVLWLVDQFLSACPDSICGVSTCTVAAATFCAVRCCGLSVATGLAHAPLVSNKNRVCNIWGVPTLREVLAGSRAVRTREELSALSELLQSHCSESPVAVVQWAKHNDTCDMLLVTAFVALQG